MAQFKTIGSTLNYNRTFCYIYGSKPGYIRRLVYQIAFDAFIKIDGIEGESSDDAHQGWIEILEYGMSSNQTISKTAGSAGGATAGRINFSEFTFRKFLDKSTPKLALACAAGTHIDSIAIELCRAGGDKTKFMEYRLTNSIISEVLSTGQGRFSWETISINFGRIEWSYVQQNRSGGSVVGHIAWGWDLQKNRRV